MSFDALRWALSTRAPNSAAKLLLLALADLVRPPSMKAFASASTLSATTQLDRKTVLTNLRRLEESCLIARLNETAGRGGAPVFQLLMDTARSEPESGTGSTATSPASEFSTDTKNGTGSAAPDRSQPVPDFPATGTGFPTNPSRISHEPVPKTGHKPVTSIEPVLNQKETPRVRALSVQQLVDDGLSEQTAGEWLAHRRSKRAPLTPRAWSGIRSEASKAGWTIEDAVCKAMTRGWTGFEASWVIDTSSTRHPTAADRKAALVRGFTGEARYQTATDRRNAVLDQLTGRNKSQDIVDIEFREGSAS